MFDQGGLKNSCITHAGLRIAWLVSCMPMLMADFETKIPHGGVYMHDN